MNTVYLVMGSNPRYQEEWPVKVFKHRCKAEGLASLAQEAYEELQQKYRENVPRSFLVESEYLAEPTTPYDPHLVFRLYGTPRYSVVELELE